jgi:hypothetical protein
MGASDLAELAVDVLARLDNAWMLFLSINSTIIGGVILIQRTFNRVEKSVASGIYLVIVWMNYNTVSKGINLLASIYADIAKYQFGPDEPGYGVVTEMTLNQGGRLLWEYPWIIPTIYICAITVTIGAIAFDEKITKTTS